MTPRPLASACGSVQLARFHHRNSLHVFLLCFCLFPSILSLFLPFCFYQLALTPHPLALAAGSVQLPLFRHPNSALLLLLFLFPSILPSFTLSSFYEPALTPRPLASTAGSFQLFLPNHESPPSRDFEISAAREFRRLLELLGLAGNTISGCHASRNADDVDVWDQKTGEEVRPWTEGRTDRAGDGQEERRTWR